MDDISSDTSWATRREVWVEESLFSLGAVFGPIGTVLSLGRAVYLNYGNAKAREFVWHAGSCRFMETAKVTKQAIRAWLEQTCCGEPVGKGP